MQDVEVKVKRIGRCKCKKQDNQSICDRALSISIRR